MNFKLKLSERWKLASDEMFTVIDTPGDWISLTDSQIGLLEDNGNSSEDWSRVSVYRDAALNSVWNCFFKGH